MDKFRGKESSGLDDAIESLAEAVIGAAIEVHRHLRPGLPEVAYRNALCYELKLRKIEFECEVSLPVNYKGIQVAEGRLDLLVGRCLIVELKVVEALAPVHRAQTLSYLKATKLRLALLINFNAPVLKDAIKRIINTI
jgi:GxxExxY protein